MAYQRKIPSPKSVSQTKAPVPNPKPAKMSPSMRQGFTNQAQTAPKKKK